MSRLAALLGPLGSLAVTCSLLAQIAEVRATKDQIVDTDHSGESYRLTDPGMNPQSIRVSPSRQKLVYSMTFAQGSNPLGPLIVKVWSPSLTNKLREIQLPTYARFIDNVEWMDDRYVFVSGDANGIVVDSEGGGATQNLWGKFLGGKAFFLSPDRHKIIYAEGMGRVPSDHVSDVAEVAVLGKGLAPSEEPRGLEAGVSEIYPPKSDPTRGTPTPIPGRRHTFLSGFLWFSDSTRVSFVEEEDGAVWLVTLTQQVSGPSVPARHERFSLRVHPGKVEAFSWLKPDQELQVVIAGSRLVVQPERQLVRREDSP